MGTKVVTVPQPDRTRFRFTLIAAVILAILGTLLVVRTFPDLFIRQAPAVDDPILMAGGSLTIRGAPGGQFNVSGHDAVYTPESGKVVRVDILYRDASGAPAFTSLPFSSTDAVQLSYCSLDKTCASVSARSNPSGHGFVYGPVDGDTIPPGSNMFTQNPSTGYIDSVVFAGTTYGCRDADGANGQCSIVVRYCRLCK